MLAAGGLATRAPGASFGCQSAPGHGRWHRRWVLDAHVEAVVQVGLGLGDQRPTTLADKRAGRVGRCLPVARLGLRRRIWLGHEWPPSGRQPAKDGLIRVTHWKTAYPDGLR